MFQLPNQAPIYYLEGEYSIPLVILSIVIALGASYTALFINKQIQSNSFFHQFIWLTLASLAMGLGIWSMHFIGMSAFMLPIPMTHNTSLTIVSAIPAVLASFFAFYLANRKNKRIRTHIAASILMGLGISTMHYLGMAAMELNASYVYKPVMLGISVLIAVLASFAALFIFSYGTKITDNLLIKLTAAAFMAAAVSSMHYIGMYAIQFYTFESAYLSDGVHAHREGLMATVLFISIGICSLFVLTYLTSRLDQYVNFRIKNFDSLTQLPNHNQFTVDQKVDKYATLVSIIHLHNFEKFISGYGYTYGDKILLEVKTLILKILPKDAKVYRTEANRFTVVMPIGADSQSYPIALERICSILSKPMLIGNHFVTVEMGCAISSTGKPERIHDHFSNAIAVLQASSTRFKHQLIMYNPLLHTYNYERKLAQDLTEAMVIPQMYLVYQPKIDPKTGTLAGLEALIRWNHPEYGMISPAEFIPILEASNRIAELTDWIIEQVCRQIEKWNNANISFRQVSINIPGSYVTSPRLTDTINECLMRHNVPASQIELEITETSVIHDIQNAIQAVCQFRSKGLNVALDDFGTGLSSLSYLKEIPITTIKIDKSFVDDVPSSQKDAAILSAILNLCYSLDLNVVIEGVESEEQIAYLLAMPNVPIVQGYFYSKPLNSIEFNEWYSKFGLIPSMSS